MTAPTTSAIDGLRQLAGARPALARDLDTFEASLRAALARLLIARVDHELLDAERRRLARIVEPTDVDAELLHLLDDEAERRALRRALRDES